MAYRYIKFSQEEDWDDWDDEVVDTPSYQLHPTKVSLPKQAISRLMKASWGFDAIKVVLDYIPNVDGYESYQNSFDVSYVGSIDQLRNAIAGALLSAGVDFLGQDGRALVFNIVGKHIDTYVYVRELEEGEDFSLTEDSTGYEIYVEDVE